MFVQFFSKLLRGLQPRSTYRRTAAIFFSYRNGSFLNAEGCIMQYQVRTARGSSNVWRINGSVYSDYGVFGLWYLAVLSVFPRSKLPVYGALKWTGFEGICMEGGYPVPQQEDRRLSSPGRQRRHTRKSKVNRNLCPCELYDKDFNSFYLLTKISLIFRRQIEHKIRDLLNVNKNPTDATVCRYLFTVKLLYMFRVSQHLSSGVLKTVLAASGTGHTTCTATPLLRGLIWTGLCDSHKPVQIRPRIKNCTRSLRYRSYYLYRYLYHVGGE